MSKKSTTAAAQFADLGIAKADWTDTMRLAVKQKWSSLPVDEKVDVLRARLAAVEVPAVPEVADLAASGAADPEAEAKRLRRNAAVTAWRQRKQLQAALDARELKFAALRAKRGSKVDPAPAEAAMAVSA